MFAGLQAVDASAFELRGRIVYQFQRSADEVRRAERGNKERSPALRALCD
jgi:hypothetical protein